MKIYSDKTIELLKRLTNRMHDLYMQEWNENQKLREMNQKLLLENLQLKKDLGIIKEAINPNYKVEFPNTEGKEDEDGGEDFIDVWED